MKRIYLIILAISCLFVSCGEQSSVPTNVRFTRSFAVSGQNGGLIFMGRRIDEAQSFMVNFEDIQELDLLPGTWEFAAIGWENEFGDGNFTGTTRCSYSGLVEISPPEVEIEMGLSQTRCSSLAAVANPSGPNILKEVFGDYFNDSNNNDFRKVSFITCKNVTDGILTSNCAGSGRGETQSIQITYEFSIEEFGQETQLSTSISECINIQTNTHFEQSEIKLPSRAIYDKSGPIPKFSLFTEPNCINTSGDEVIEYDLDEGEGKGMFADPNPASIRARSSENSFKRHAIVKGSSNPYIKLYFEHSPSTTNF